MTTTPLTRVALLIIGVTFFGAPATRGANQPPSMSPSSTMTFYHHSVGTCYLDNGLGDVAARHGYDLIPVEFALDINCACDLRDWFAANPSAMTGAVLVKSCFDCSNLWSDSDVSSDRACYAQLRAQAAQNGASLFIIAPTPYEWTTMEQNGWRIDAQRGADLMGSLETGHAVDPFLNANRLLRDPSLPYLAVQYMRTSGNSHPNDAGCRVVVNAIDSWLPYFTPPAQCTIGGQNHNDGWTNPANVCQVCDVSRSPTAWSINDGAACTDGVFCNGADTCSGGTCSVHAGDPCGSGKQCDEAGKQCLPTTDDDTDDDTGDDDSGGGAPRGSSGGGRSYCGG